MSAAAGGGDVTADPQSEDPLESLHPAQDYVDPNGVDLATGKLRVSGDLLASGSDGLGIGFNFVSPSFSITPAHFTSDPPLSVANSLGQILYASLSTNAVLTWQQEDESGAFPYSFVNFDSPTHHDKFVLLGSSFFNAANTSSSLVPSGSGYVYTGKDGATAELSGDLTYLQLYAPSAPASGYRGNLVERLTQPNGEVWTYYYDKATFRRVASGVIFTSSRIRSIVSNRGYGLQFSYQRDAAFQDGLAQIDQWYSVTRIVKYDKARTYCDEASGARCASFGSDARSLDISYDRLNNQVRLSRQNGESMMFGFSVEPRWGAWRLVSVEKGDIPATRRNFTYREYPQITYPGGSSIPNPVTWLDNVQAVSAGGQVWNYEFGGTRYSGALDFTGTMRATDPLGGVRALDMALSQDPPTKITDPLGRVTEFTYFRYPWSAIVKGAWPNPQDALRPNDTVAYPATVTLPEDVSAHLNSMEFTYDDRGNRLTAKRNAKAGSGLAPIVWTASYPACGNLKICNKPFALFDPRGGATVYAYDAAHGGVVSEMGAEPSYGAARPLKLHSYAQRYAYVLNAGGALVPSMSPLWVRTSTILCQTQPGSNVPVCDGNAPQTVMAYEYGSDGTVDNLLLRGVAVTADGQTLRTCYRYDAQGNKTSMTKARAGLSNCQ